MKMVLASKNAHKLTEMKDILSRLGVDVVLESEAGVDVDVEETGATFEENARLKAHAVMQASGLPAIADDSGLCVDALGGAPGVYSARYGGEGLDDIQRYRLLFLYLLLLPGRGRGRGPGGVLRRPGLCAPGRGRIRLRPHLLCARAEKNLFRADGPGEERHLPPGEGVGFI